MYRIGEFSKMSKTPVKTLRYYDEVDLLKPESVDEYNGYRLYTTNQLIILHKIKSLRQIGLSINEIRMILLGDNEKFILENRRKELIEEIDLCTEQLSRLNFILQCKKEDSFMNYEATIKDLPECIVYYKKMTIPNYDSYFELIPAIGEEITKANPNLKCSVPEYCFIVYLDGEYKEKDIHVEYCEAVEDFGNETGEIKFKKIKSVPAVSVMHKGPYSELSNAYAYAFKWIEENGYSITDNPRESYIDGIWNKEKESDWLTELQIPIIHK